MPVNTGTFIDTNVLIYILDSDAQKADKSRQALQAGGVVSVQTLNEVTNVMRRKIDTPWPQIREFLDLVQVFCDVRNVTQEDHVLGLEIAERYGLQVFDSMLLATATRVGCSVLLSEDMQHDQLIGSLRIRNPYLS